MSVYKDKKTKNWVVTLRYTDINGQEKRRAKRGFKTKKEAQQWEINFLANINKDEDTPNIDISFDEFYQVYMNDISNKLRFTTIRGKRARYEAHIKNYFGNKKMTKINTSDIIKWQNEILGKNFKPTYNRSISNELHAVFNHAHKYYGLKDPPIKKVAPIGKSQAEAMDFWTKEEFDRFIDVVDDDVSRIIFYVLFYTGIRTGELIAIKLKNIDFDRGHIEIKATAIYEKGKYIFSKPKTPKSKRNVTLPYFLVRMIRDYVDRFYFIDMEEQLFPTTKYRLYRDMRKYCPIANVKVIRIHDLRHSHASLLIEQGIQPNIVQERLGHEKIETTLRTYSHMYPNKQYHLADFLDQLATDPDKIVEKSNRANPLLISTTK